MIPLSSLIEKAQAQGLNITPVTPAGTPGLGAVDPRAFIATIGGSIIDVLLVLAGVLAAIYLVWAGISFITSAGSIEKAKTARAAIVNAMIGIIVIVAAYSIIRFSVQIGNTVATADTSAQVAVAGAGGGVTTPAGTPLRIPVNGSIKGKSKTSAKVYPPGYTPPTTTKTILNTNSSKKSLASRFVDTAQANFLDGIGKTIKNNPDLIDLPIPGVIKDDYSGYGALSSPGSNNGALSFPGLNKSPGTSKDKSGATTTGSKNISLNIGGKTQSYSPGATLTLDVGTFVNFPDGATLISDSTMDVDILSGLEKITISADAVDSQSGKSIAGTTISITVLDTNAKVATATTANGPVSIIIAPPGYHAIKFEHSGYRTCVIDVNFHNDSSFVAKMNLGSPSTREKCNSVQTGDLGPNDPGKIQTITPGQRYTAQGSVIAYFPNGGRITTIDGNQSTTSKGQKVQLQAGDYAVGADVTTTKTLSSGERYTAQDYIKVTYPYGGKLTTIDGNQSTVDAGYTMTLEGGDYAVGNTNVTVLNPPTDSVVITKENSPYLATKRIPAEFPDGGEVVASNGQVELVIRAGSSTYLEEGETAYYGIRQAVLK